MKLNQVHLIGIAAAALAITAASIAGSTQAADIRNELPANLIAEHCLAKGVGSNEEGVFLLPGGKRLTGSILCTDADMVAPPKAMSGDDGDNENSENEGDDD